MTRGQRAGVVIVVGAVAWWCLRRRSPIATVTTSETFALAPADYPDGVDRVAQAIARAEGYYAGPNTIPVRANNPGNLKLGQPWIDSSQITKFDSASDGWAALKRQLALIIAGGSAHYTLDTTIAEMGRKWTATVSEQGAWAMNVASSLGVSTNARLSEVLL